MSGKEPDYRVTLQGVYDPPEPEEPLPEGLLRPRQGPLNKRSGRRSSDRRDQLRSPDRKKTEARNAM